MNGVRMPSTFHANSRADTRVRPYEGKIACIVPHADLTRESPPDTFPPSTLKSDDELAESAV